MTTVTSPIFGPKLPTPTARTSIGCWTTSRSRRPANLLSDNRILWQTASALKQLAPPRPAGLGQLRREPVRQFPQRIGPFGFGGHLGLADRHSRVTLGL